MSTERDIKILSIPEGLEVEEVESINLLENRDTAILCFTDKGTFLIEPTLDSMTEIERGSLALAGQRRMQEMTSQPEATKPANIFTCRHRAFIPFDVTTMKLRGRLGLAALLLIGADQKASALSDAHTKTPQGDEAKVLRPGLHVSMETGVNGTPWRADRSEYLDIGKIIALYKVVNFTPDTKIAQTARMPKSDSELAIEAIADDLKRRRGEL